MKTLLSDYKEFEKIIKENENETIIDASSYDFLAPTTLIPLIYEVKNENKTLKVSKYNTTIVEKILNIENTNNDFFIKPTKDNLYLNLPTERIVRNEEELNNRFADKLDESYGGLWYQRFMLQELTNNIYDHAYDKENTIKFGINYAHEYPQENYLDVCIFDQGKSIAGSYKDAGIDYDDDCHAIEKALSKESTSDDKETRGNGLRTTINKLITENKGNALIVSGNGYLYIKEKEKYEYGFTSISNGTLISLRLTKNHVNRFMDIGEFQFLNPYKYKRGEK